MRERVFQIKKLVTFEDVKLSKILTVRGTEMQTVRWAVDVAEGDKDVIGKESRPLPATRRALYIIFKAKVK